MVRAVGAEHFASPGEDFVGVFTVHDKAHLPGGEAFEGGIQFAAQEGFFVMQITLHGMDIGGLILDVGAVVLFDRAGVLEAGGQREAAQHPVLRLRADLLDDGKNLHRLAELSEAGTTGHHHLHHQGLVGKQLLHQCGVFRALLAEFGESVRGGRGEHKGLGELPVEGVAGEEGIH